MSKLPVGAMILSAALTACSDHRTPELVARAEPMPATWATRAHADAATVYFAFDGFELDAQARLVLDAEARRMSGRLREEFIVVGHADRVGSPEYNVDLGMRRALNVVNYLVSKGIARERLVPTVSYGELSPAIAVDHAERLNRRVVILPKKLSHPASVALQEDGDPVRVRLANLSDQDQSNDQPSSGGTTDLPVDPGSSGDEAQDQPDNSGAPQEPGSDPSENEGGGSVSEENTGPAEGPGNEQSIEPGNGPSNGNNGQGPEQDSGQGTGSGGSQESGPGNGSNSNNQSGTRTDAGRGNGAEDGDPGNSGGRNNGGDDD